MNTFNQIVVLDTNVILHDPQSIFKFPQSLVVIPLVVIEELDGFKKNQDENGRNSRQFSRYIEDLRKKGDISSGIPLNNESVLKVDTNGKIEGTPLETQLVFNKPDYRILSTAYHEMLKNPNQKVTLISKDTNLRIKCDVVGVDATDYEEDKVRFDEMYTGLNHIKISGEVIDILLEDGEVPIYEGLPKLYPNQYLLLIDETKESHKTIARFDKKKEALVPICRKVNQGVKGIFPRNLEQTVALDLLLNDDIKLVSLVGKAGTGKTLLAVAVGMTMSLDMGNYKKLLVSRPILPLGKDIGYLPGDLNEKLGPWMKPIFDNIDYITQNGDSHRNVGQDLIDRGLIVVEPITYIRGRSIPNQYIIVDEAQNLTPHELKTILTRAGEGTKIVLTGDTFQVDSPYLDSTSNGLAYVVERVKDLEIAGHVTLTKGERSELAEVTSNVL